jgi:hypothetical protein
VKPTRRFVFPQLTHPFTDEYARRTEALQLKKLREEASFSNPFVKPSIGLIRCTQIEAKKAELVLTLFTSAFLAF